MEISELSSTIKSYIKKILIYAIAFSLSNKILKPFATSLIQNSFVKKTRFKNFFNSFNTSEASESSEAFFALDMPRKDETPFLFVDLTFLALHDAKTGIQRVVRSILQELVLNPPQKYQVEPVYCSPTAVGYRYADNYMSCFMNQPSKGNTDEFISVSSNDIFLALDLNFYLENVQRSYFEALKQKGLRIYVVVYDLLPIKLPSAFPPIQHEIFSQWLSFIATFDGAICISESVANELSDWVKLNQPDCLSSFNITWAHLGADLENSVPTLGIPDNADKVIKVLSSTPTFLMVGTLEPRKGHDQVLGAFEMLWKNNQDVNLVIIGAGGWLVDKLIARLNTHPEGGKHLFWFQGVSDEFLAKLYSASTCLIAASKGEGFGLPLIEAGKYKLPIIARDIPVFREIAGDHAYYFSGSKAQDLSSTIIAWLALFKEKKHPLSNSMPWITWKETTKQILDIIQ